MKDMAMSTCVQNTKTDYKTKCKQGLWEMWDPEILELYIIDQKSGYLCLYCFSLDHSVSLFKAALFDFLGHLAAAD